MASAGRCNTLLRQIVSFDPLDGTNMVGVSSAAQTLTFDWWIGWPIMTHKLSAAQSQRGAIVVVVAAAAVVLAAAAAEMEAAAAVMGT